MTTEHLEASLRLADDLLAKGRVLDALDMLTKLNREQRDPDVEERLVLLRRDAFSELEHSDGRGSWPPEFEDPFKDVDGLVEIQGPDLSLEALGGAIQHHGHLLVRGLLPRATVDRLVDAVDRAFQARDAHQQGTPVSETAPWFVPIPSHPDYPTAPSAVGFERFAPTKVLVVDSPRALFEVTEAFREAGLDRLVGNYLGDRPVMAENKWTLRRMVAEQLGKAPWHQEAPVFDSGPLRTVNVWLTLSPCGANAPGFQFVPRRMDSIIEPELSFGLTRKTVVRVADGATIVAPIYEPGDAVLFDEYLVHRTKAEPEMSELRRSIESWMFAPSGHPLRERYAPVVL
jgi:phytanoyl-CoA dioxygenase PhyH